MITRNPNPKAPTARTVKVLVVGRVTKPLGESGLRMAAGRYAPLTSASFYTKVLPMR